MMGYGYSERRRAACQGCLVGSSEAPTWCPARSFGISLTPWLIIFILFPQAHPDREFRPHETAAVVLILIKDLNPVDGGWQTKEEINNL
ncbi:hypothetical protein KQX54_020169 [Cotesia glomerata]|uniref:Uncharacterized protein n=1 Tax=Cotesia glomerata TaxID=32391 RepID=A0AAV7I4H6_COTGL|nr:hypothetical protein KQX54_020169 [Cotesia glomerata]